MLMRPKRTKLNRSLFQIKIISLFIINPYQRQDILIDVWEYMKNVYYFQKKTIFL